jgi:hypothetical protein
MLGDLFRIRRLVKKTMYEFPFKARSGGSQES